MLNFILLIISMKMRLQIRSKIKNLLCSSLFLAPVLFFCCSNAKADGVILIKGNPTQSPQFWTALAFRKIEGFSITYTVSLTNGQLRNFRKDEVGAILEEPKWQEMTVVSDADWQDLGQQKTQLLSSASQYPQLKDWANAIAAKFDAAFARQSAGMVVYRGKVISKDDYDKMRGMAPSASSSGFTLILDDKSFNNVKISSLRNGTLAILHDGGIASIKISDLSEKQKQQLSEFSPDKFGSYLKEERNRMSAEKDLVEKESQLNASHIPLVAATLVKDYNQFKSRIADILKKNKFAPSLITVDESIAQSSVNIPEPTPDCKAGIYTSDHEHGPAMVWISKNEKIISACVGVYVLSDAGNNILINKEEIGEAKDLITKIDGRLFEAIPTALAANKIRAILGQGKTNLTSTFSLKIGASQAKYTIYKPTIESGEKIAQHIKIEISGL